MFPFPSCFWISIILISISSAQDDDTINIYAISNLQITYGRIIVAAQKLAFEYINNNEPNLLTNYNLNLTLLDAEEDTTVALQHVFDIMNTIEDEVDSNLNLTDIILPVVLGCPYSSLSSTTAPALAAINWAQISSTATSISLSDQSRYPSFYRSIAADSLQSAGIIGLLEHFGWTKFAIIYVNDVYGIYLGIEIMRLASIHPSKVFEVSPIAYTSEDIESIQSAVTQLKLSDKFIVVLLVHEVDISPLFNELADNDRWGYPYYYIGVDAWFDDTVIERRDIAKFSQGYLGTAPWGSHMLQSSDYTHRDLKQIYNDSHAKYELFNNLWKSKYEQDPQFVYNISTPSALSSYGFDSAYTVAYILQYILDKYGKLDGDLLRINSTEMNGIITNKIGFVGTTGNVSYKDNGDRDKALFAYGNIMEDNQISWVGYFSDYYNVTYLSFDNIIWPKDFTDKGMIPRSDVLITDSLMTINENLFITFTFFSSVSMIIAIIYMILTLKYRGEKIMRAASWKLNLVSCSGCIIAYIYVILIGLNESQNYSRTQLNGICAVIPWLLCIAFTLVFMPLFLKTYRVGIIFTKILKKIVLTDGVLLIAVGCCVMIDILLLTIFTAISPQQRIYKDGLLETVDELRQTQNMYAQCISPNDSVNYSFYGIMGVYKLLQLLFGIYCCLIVSRIGINEIRKFDETSTQLIAIVISISLFILSIVIIAFLAEYETNWLYSIQSLMILIICNICLSFNLCPRFIAIFKGNEERYRTTPEEELQNFIEDKLREIFKENGGKMDIVTMESLRTDTFNSILTTSDKSKEKSKSKSSKSNFNPKGAQTPSTNDNDDKEIYRD